MVMVALVVVLVGQVQLRRLQPVLWLLHLQLPRLQLRRLQLRRLPPHLLCAAFWIWY